MRALTRVLSPVILSQNEKELMDYFSKTNDSFIKGNKLVISEK